MIIIGEPLYGVLDKSAGESELSVLLFRQLLLKWRSFWRLPDG